MAYRAAAQLRPSFLLEPSAQRAWRAPQVRARATLKGRARGMPGALCTRSLACDVKMAHELVTTGPPESPGIPARNGFNGFLRALPGDRALLSPSPARCVRPVRADIAIRKLDASVEASGPH